MFKRRLFPVEIMLVCVRWYCKYGMSYRDLTEMMLDVVLMLSRPRSCAGFIATHLNWRNESGGIRDIALRLGAQTRPTSRSAAGGSSSSGLLTNTANLSTSCCQTAGTPALPTVFWQSAEDDAPLATILDHHGPARFYPEPSAGCNEKISFQTRRSIAPAST